MTTVKQKKEALVCIPDDHLIPGKLKEVFGLLVEKAYEEAGISSVNTLIINATLNYPKQGAKNIYSNFTPPNIINLNIKRHLQQMEDLAHLPMRSATLLWLELLRSVGHELYHALVEFRSFDSAYGNNKEALQIGPNYNCKKAETWGKKLVMALGFNINIDPPNDWGIGSTENNKLSTILSDWQHNLPSIDEPWAKRQQKMIDGNIVWLDDDEPMEITLEHFSDWLALEGGWDMPAWKVRVENVTTPIDVQVEESSYIETPDPAGITPTDYEEDYYDNIAAGKTEIDSLEPPPTNNVTLADMTASMYYAFMAVYQQMFERCGWQVGISGEFSFTNAAEITKPFSIPQRCNPVIAEFGSTTSAWLPVQLDSTIYGMVYMNGTLPAVKLKVMATNGKLIQYDLIAQNPLKDGAWSRASKAGAKALVVFRKDEAGASAIAVRIVNGQFIADPLGKAQTITI